MTSVVYETWRTKR